MNETIQKVYRELKEFQARFHGVLSELAKETDASVDLTTLADTNYAMREADKLADELGISIRKVQNVAAKRACLQWVLEADPEREKIVTDYCTAVPAFSIAVQPAKAGTPEYDLMMEDLGFAPEVYRAAMMAGTEQRPPLKFDHKEMIRFLTARQAAGLPLPRGVEAVKVYNEFALDTRKKQDVLASLDPSDAGVF